MKPDRAARSPAERNIDGAGGAVELDARLAQREIDLRLRLRPGEVVALLGPNGAGKSTLVSLLAGLITPDSGRIVLDGRVLVDTDRGVWVPAHQRGVALLAQQAMLFPHLTAAANVAFGPRSQGRTRSGAAALATRWLQAVDAAELADRRPSQLSGGQAQRVAVARALAADPVLLLLDEPIAALDVAVAPAIRQLLRKVLRNTGRTAVLVTHDILDALALADRIIVLAAGRVAEDGPVRDVLSRPRSGFTARIAGINLIAGTADSHGLTTAVGSQIQGILDPACQPGESAVAMFKPSAVAVHLTRPTGSPRNHLAVTITALEPRDEQVRVRTADNPDRSAGPFADITAAAATDLELVPGSRVHFAVKASEVTIYPAGNPHPSGFRPEHG